MAGWVASGEIKVKLLDTFDQFGISSCSLVIIFFNYNFLLLLFSLVIIFSCYQGSRDSCRRVRQDAPGPDGTLHRGQHRQDGRQGLSQHVWPWLALPDICNS